MVRGQDSWRPLEKSKGGRVGFEFERSRPKKLE
jgi:hypothetical protein